MITSWLSHFHEMEQGNYPFFFKALGKGKRKQKYICILKIKNGKEKKDTSENIFVVASETDVSAFIFVCYNLHFFLHCAAGSFLW